MVEIIEIVNPYPLKNAYTYLRFDLKSLNYLTFQALIYTF